MSKTERPVNELSFFLPDGSSERVIEYLQHYSVHLTVTRKRSTILGDYRAKHDGKPHRISVNGNLNKYSFLITLLHELAHLLTFEKFANKVLPHGNEWKIEFSEILKEFLAKDIFPQDVKRAVLKSIHNPAASTCSDVELLKVLRTYDKNYHKKIVVEEVAEGKKFKIKNSQVYIRGPRQRTRYKCRETTTGRWFLFHGMYEVEEVLEG
ncbi:MAG: SprT-like domain-containing protein [Bacteroidetes bacterium]|nr:SprT-like domain-containing protein [Bacteroidota bacterium]